MPAPPLTILYEDNHVLAIAKPAGLPTMGAAAGQASVITLARQYLKEKHAKPGNVYVGIVSRLDAAVTGVVVLARSSKAAARLTDVFRRRAMRKRYWALIEGVLAPAEGACLDWLRKDEHHHRMRVARPDHPAAQEARLTYRTLATFLTGSPRARSPRAGTGPLPHPVALLAIDLETGRKHQIRVQLAERGHPILGDAKYGAMTPFPAGIALHARELEFLHPVRRTPLRLIAPLPADWRHWGIRETADGNRA
jgi:23S rRNA pseudouridine1911/1915/1917 synthase